MLPVQVAQGRAWQPGAGDQGAPPWEFGQTRTWADAWAGVTGTHGQAGQGCGDLEPGTAAASLGQGLTGLRLKWGSEPYEVG